MVSQVRIIRKVWIWIGSHRYLLASAFHGLRITGFQWMIGKVWIWIDFFRIWIGLSLVLLALVFHRYRVIFINNFSMNCLYYLIKAAEQYVTGNLIFFQDLDIIVFQG